MKRMVIALVSEKGGVAKTTTAACIAAELHRRGVDVALLDVDPLTGLADWHRSGGPLEQLELATASGAAVDPTLQALMKAHQVVVVDTPGFFNRDTLAALRWADVAIVPFGPSPGEARGAIKTIKTINTVNTTAERRRKPIEALLVATKTERTAIAAHIRAQMEATGQRVLKASMAKRVIYAEAQDAGSAPCWMGAAGREAADEVEAILAEITI